jgi:hypothetical protein
MKKTNVWIYIITLLTLILPVFFISSTEPSIYSVERLRLIDSTIFADSVHSFESNTIFNSQDKVYKKYLQNKVDSICTANSLLICPSLECFSYDKLTGIGLLIRFCNNGFLVLIPFLFYIWTIFSICSILINKIKTSKYIMIGGLIIDLIMILTIIMIFTISIYFYIISLILLITEFSRFKKIRKTPANKVYNP